MDQNSRIGLLLGGGVLLVGFGGYMIGFPDAIVVSATLLFIVGVFWLWGRRLAAAHMKERPDPELAARVTEICSRLGHFDCQPLIIDGGGEPVVNRHRGRLLVSPLAGQILSDSELQALILLALVKDDRAAAQEGRRRNGPALLVLGLSTVVSVTTGVMWFGFVGIVLLLWYLARGRRGLVMKDSARASITAYLAQNGDPSALASGVVKVSGVGLPEGERRAVYVAQVRGALQMIAELGGLSHQQVDDLIAAAQAPQAFLLNQVI